MVSERVLKSVKKQGILQLGNLKLLPRMWRGKAKAGTGEAVTILPASWNTGRPGHFCGLLSVLLFVFPQE